MDILWIGFCHLGSGFDYLGDNLFILPNFSGLKKSKFIIDAPRTTINNGYDFLLRMSKHGEPGWLTC